MINGDYDFGDIEQAVEENRIKTEEFSDAVEKFHNLNLAEKITESAKNLLAANGRIEIINQKLAITKNAFKAANEVKYEQ